MLFSYAPINPSMYVRSKYVSVGSQSDQRSQIEKWLTGGMFAWTTNLSFLLSLVSACMPREATFLKVFPFLATALVDPLRGEDLFV